MSVSITGSGVSVTNAVASLSGLPNQANNTILSNVSGGSAAPSANTVTATLDSTISSTDGKMLARGASTWAATDIPVSVCGRLTLTTGTPVLTSNVTGATSIFFTPYRGNTIPIYDGTAFVPTAFTELTNTTTDNTTNPAACTTNAVYDLFVWSNSGTPTLSRGPVWSSSATVTMTIANPCVVTWTSHGLSNGMVVYFTTTGALPNGGTNNVVASTDYFITVVDANSFKLSTTLANQVAGTFVNTLGGAQSGVHTGFNKQTSRGTGAGTSQIGLTNGILTNTVAITNGPAANRGTYVGTVMTDGSSQVNWQYAAIAANCTPGIFGVWNNYNRIWQSSGLLGDTTDSWNYTSATLRPMNNSSTARVSFVTGRSEDAVQALHNMKLLANANGTAGRVMIGVNSDNTMSGFSGTYVAVTNTTAMRTEAVANWIGIPAIGANYITPLEYASTTTVTFYGDAGGPTIEQSGMVVNFFA